MTCPSLTWEDAGVDLALQGAVFQGLYAIPATDVFNCSSVCEWKSSYISLGFSSSCEDVTTATRDNMVPLQSSSDVGRGFNGTTPGNLSISLKYVPTSWQNVAQVTSKSLLGIQGGYSERSGPGFSQPADLIRIAVTRAPLDKQNYVFTKDKIEVFECTVSLAAFNYSGVSASGNGFHVGSLTKIPLLPAGVLANRSRADGRVLFDTFLVFEQPGLPSLEVAISDLGALVQLFQSSRFSGEVSVGIFGDGVPPSVGLGSLLREGDVGQKFESMAKTMTDQLRSRYNATAEGVAIVPVLYVRVEWQWLSLPLLVQLTSIILLVLTILSSATHKQLPLWKGSSLAALFHVVKVDENHQHATLESPITGLDELEEKAKLKAKLV
jgi:hypothetical protein